MASKSLNLCLQVLKISDLWFNEAPSLENMMWYFFFKHSLHFLVVGLKGGALSMMSHSSFDRTKERHNVMKEKKLRKKQKPRKRIKTLSPWVDWILLFIFYTFYTLFIAVENTYLNKAYTYAWSILLQLARFFLIKLLWHGFW